MKTIRQNIKDNSFKNIYLLYGGDEYMKKLYQSKLKTALLDGTDDMNYTYITGDKPDVRKIIEVADTVPFFFERRLIVLEDTNLLKDANDLADYLKTAPDTTFFVFCEKNVDKRSKLYKTIKDIGYSVEMNGLTEYELIAFIKSEVKKCGLAISDFDASYMLNKVGGDMNVLVNECAKVSSYAADRGTITRNDIDEICITLLENKIFEMLDYIASGDRNKALTLYNNLIALRESPAKILRLITRHFNILFRMSEGRKEGVSDKDICSALKIPPFAVKKYSAQLSHFTSEKLKDAIEDCLDTEERFKTGRLDEQIGVEILIIRYS